MINLLNAQAYHIELMTKKKKTKQNITHILGDKSEDFGSKFTLYHNDNHSSTRHFHDKFVCYKSTWHAWLHLWIAVMYMPMQSRMQNPILS